MFKLREIVLWKIEEDVAHLFTCKQRCAGTSGQNWPASDRISDDFPFASATPLRSQNDTSFRDSYLE